MVASGGSCPSLTRSLGTKGPVIKVLRRRTRPLLRRRMNGESPAEQAGVRGVRNGSSLWSLAAKPPDGGESSRDPFSTGEAACPPDAASPDLRFGGALPSGPGEGARSACAGKRGTDAVSRRHGPRDARTPSRSAFPQPGRVSMAVAEGFEPSVSFPTLAFEASSFGRSDTLPRESLDHAGLWKEIGSQPARKKAVSWSAHSGSRTPWTTSGRWLRRRSRTTSQSEPAAPAFSSRAP